MHKNKFFQKLLALLLCISIVLPFESVRAGLGGNGESLIPNQQELEEIAKAKLFAQNRILTENLEIESMNQIDTLYPLYARTFNSEMINTLMRKKEILTLHNTRYVNFQTEFTSIKVVATDLQATLVAVEYTIFNVEVLDANGFVDVLAPTTTEYVQQHTFIFKNIQGKWFLINDRLDNSPKPVKPDLSLPPVKEVQPTGIDTSSGESMNEIGVKGATIYKSRIATYARTYWKNYNPSYRKWSQDCTNFISQAVRYGRWPYVSGYYMSTSAWWYNSLNQSRTWVNAHYWWWFTYNRPRGYIASYISDMRVGDILQIDFDRDGYIDHSMVVTKRDSYGTIYLTYHTTNTLDKSFWDIYSQYPDADYYGWRLYTYVN